MDRTVTLSQAARWRPCGRRPTAEPLDGHAVAMHLTVRVDARRRWALRQEVGRLRARESRRVFDPSVHVGILGGERTGFVLRAKDRPVLDAALRTEVACRLLADAPPHWHTTWLVRAGSPEEHDLDLQWLSAARMGFGMYDRLLEGCFVVTRSGWRDVVTGERREWTRLRLQPGS